jgi:hypothetical protein
VNPRDEAERNAILARLAETRAEIKRLLEPRAEEEGEAEAEDGIGFPRSRTMRALLSSRGLGAVGATAAGLVLARPGLAWKLIRMVPADALLRVALARFLGGMRERRAPRP